MLPQVVTFARPYSSRAVEANRDSVAASATSLFRSCTSTSGCATTLTAYRILCLRFAPLVRRGSHNSAWDARLDTGGRLTLSRQGLSHCKIRRALPGAITTKLRLGQRIWRRERARIRCVCYALFSQFILTFLFLATQSLRYRLIRL